ncbi:MAG: hypothetical protein ACR2G7_08130 [Acidimicrobiales bacterium]
MNRMSLRWVVWAVAVAGFLAPAGVAWACVGIMSLTTSASSVQPGGTVTVFGREFAQKEPVEIHLDSPTGPLLATAPPPESTMTSRFEVMATIPADVGRGPHLLVATQNYHHMNAGAPARASIFVGTEAPAPASPPSRPTGVVMRSTTNGVALALIGLAVAAGGLIVAGLLQRRSSDQRRPAEPATA